MKLSSLSSTLVRRLGALALSACLLAPPALATWSIVVVNTRTGEVCVASATCLSNVDLGNLLPVIRVGVGAAAAQSFVDGSGFTRRLMWNGLIDGVGPPEILAMLAELDGGHETRQYGIVSMDGYPVTFSGTGAGFARFGVVGIDGDLRYAIQGNVLTDNSVVIAARDAMLGTPGDLGQKVMAGMEAARALGGDGRCSCAGGNPPCPPPANFTKSAHSSSIQLARMGDADDPICQVPLGCANGVYYLDRDVLGDFSKPDPILVLQIKYNTWRGLQAGKPDHLLSSVTPVATSLVADGFASTDVTVELRDVDGVAITHGNHLVTLQHAGGAKELLTPGAVVDNGDGTYTFSLGGAVSAGLDTWRVWVDDQSGDPARLLWPELKLRVDPLTDLHVGVEQVGAAAGGAVPLTLNVGSSWRRHPYLMLASAAGTSPGTPFAGTVMPLNLDPLFTFTSQMAGSATLPGTFGRVDKHGRAEGAFLPGPGMLAPYVGQRVHFSVLVFDSRASFATAPKGFDVLP